MTARTRGGVGVGVTLVALGRALPMLLMPLATAGWAQDSAEPESGRQDEMVAIILIVAIAFLLLLALVAKILELRLKRDGEAVAVRGLMSDALETRAEPARALDHDRPRPGAALDRLTRDRAGRRPGAIRSPAACRAPEHEAGGEVESDRRRAHQVTDRRRAEHARVRARGFRSSVQKNSNATGSRSIRSRRSAMNTR